MHTQNIATTTYGAEDGVELLTSDLRRRILLEGGGEGGQSPHRLCLRSLNLHSARMASDLPHLRSGHLRGGGGTGHRTIQVVRRLTIVVVIIVTVREDEDVMDAM